MKDYLELIEAHSALYELDLKIKSFFGKLCYDIQDCFYDYLREVEFRSEVCNTFEVPSGAEVTAYAVNSDGSFRISLEYIDPYEDLYDEQVEIDYPKEVIEAYLSKDRRLLHNLIIEYCKDKQRETMKGEVKDSIRFLEENGYTVTK